MKKLKTIPTVLNKVYLTGFILFLSTLFAIPLALINFGSCFMLTTIFLH